ncbi:MAG: hypothetical protein Kow00129_15600 [Thermoleophilia bacterium]
MRLGEQMEQIRRQADVGLRCVVVGPEGLAQWFSGLLRDIEIVDLEQLCLIDADQEPEDEWKRLRETDHTAAPPPRDLAIREGAPDIGNTPEQGMVYFDLTDALDAPMPSSGVLVVGKAGCQLLAYFVTRRLSTGSATEPLFQLFSFFTEAQKREERLALRLEELHKAYRDVERRLAETFFTHEFFKALTVYEPLRTVAPMIVDGTLGIMGAESCALYVRDDQSGPQLRLLASQGQNTDAYPSSFPADGEWVDQRLRNRQGEFEPLVRDEVARELLGGRPGIVGVLSRKNDLLGLLMVASEDLEYQELELERFMSVSGMAALSLQNVLLHEELEKQSITDQLTGLFNHRFFQQALEQEFVRARTAKTVFSLVMIDLDWFKELNDNHGHLSGDMFLRKVGQAIRSCVRESDIPARYGGDEFAVILPGTNEAGAEIVARKIFEAVQDIEIEVPGGAIEGRTVSVGVAGLSLLDVTPKDLFDRADQALYVAKENGRSQVRVYGGE